MELEQQQVRRSRSSTTSSGRKAPLQPPVERGEGDRKGAVDRVARVGDEDTVDNGGDGGGG